MTCFKRFVVNDLNMEGLFLFVICLLFRIVRDLTSEEVEARIRKFEKEFGMAFEKFEELFYRQKLGTRLARTYFEWAELMDNYRGYVEDGELDCTTEETREIRPEQAALLTPKRMELLHHLGAHRVESINDLAKKLRRDVKNVHQDLKVLKSFGFVKLTKRKGRALAPETLVKEITLIIR